MASPPHKMSKLAHDASENAPTLASSASRLSLSTKPPPPPKSKRLGLCNGLDRTGAKKLTLKVKPRSATSTPPDFVNHAILTLTRAMRAIQSRPPQPTPESLQALYTLCEAAVASGPTNSQLLYDRIRMEIERQAGDIRRSLARASDGGTGTEERWLAEFEKEGSAFLQQMLLVRSIFLQLDRTYVLQSPGLLSIWDLGLDVFRHSVLSDEQISNRVTSSLLSLIEMERNGDFVSRPLIRTFLVLLRTFSVQSHTSLFVEPFVASSRSFFAKEGNSLIVELDSAAYLKRVTQRLKDEGERCDSVVGSELKGSILRVVEDEMIRGHVEAIAEKDTAEMCEKDEKENLATLYSHLRRVGEVETLRKAFLDHLKIAGLNLVQDKTQDDKMVVNLIGFRKTALRLVETCFANEEKFKETISDAFKFFINKRENKPAEMMAKFLDLKLRSGNRAMDDAEMEQTLNDVLYLFRFTQGKDIFEAFYKRDLAKRLLLNKSASFDAERSMLLKLKDECGAGFTQKLEVMFKDMELSADVMRAYASKSSKSANGFDLSVSILSQGNWPSYPPFPIALPPALTAALERFKTFYVSKHSGRTLTWAHGLDTCSLKAQFPKGGRKELQVSLGQAVVLMLFNDEPDGGKISLEDIAELTKLESKELNRTLQSLACGKVRVLVKHPKGRDVNPGDQFSFNTEFKDDHIRIKINQIQQKETAEENKSTTDRVFTDRSSHLQLAIVRIMKARKTLKHSELVMEVISQIGQRFKCDPAEIKKSISSLIDREYLRRAEGQLNVYEYLA
ncbi:hypothetical protein JCM10212_004310 [Sporobolomyces blumeae]